uniref:Uncharacterized protein n=1 Tax=Moorena producens (strain JHB) TaxID=1454205 RepID=A0A1D9G4J0_MOOP1
MLCYLHCIPPEIGGQVNVRTNYQKRKAKYPRLTEEILQDIGNKRRLGPTKINGKRFWVKSLGVFGNTSKDETNSLT